MCAYVGVCSGAVCQGTLADWPGQAGHEGRGGCVHSRVRSRARLCVCARVCMCVFVCVCAFGLMHWERGAAHSALALSALAAQGGAACVQHSHAEAPKLNGPAMLRHTCACGGVKSVKSPSRGHIQAARAQARM